ncbi:MAG: hypothetical protein HKN32_02195 [Flavobacteriales bacterium]|nr:hypothetical protein [Flavobacteriales bacterium]
MTRIWIALVVSSFCLGACSMKNTAKLKKKDGRLMMRCDDFSLLLYGDYELDKLSKKEWKKIAEDPLLDALSVQSTPPEWEYVASARTFIEPWFQLHIVKGVSVGGSVSDVRTALRDLNTYMPVVDNYKKGNYSARFAHKVDRRTKPFSVLNAEHGGFEYLFIFETDTAGLALRNEVAEIASSLDFSLGK